MAKIFRVIQRWKPCTRFLPYRSVDGQIVTLPERTERQQVSVDGRVIWQYREQPETDDEWSARQW
jgi:hypothetical protein